MVHHQHVHCHRTRQIKNPRFWGGCTELTTGQYHQPSHPRGMRHQCGHHCGSRNSIQSERITRVIWIRLETSQSKIHEERTETKSRIQKSREQEISDVVKNPSKIEFEIESSPSKFVVRKYLQNKWEDHTSPRGQKFSVSVQKGEFTARTVKEDKNDTEIPSPKIQKIDGANYKIDTIRTKRLVKEQPPQRGKTWHTVQTKSTIDEISAEWMGTECDENAADPVPVKNNSRMTEITVNIILPVGTITTCL